jgi:hypothetical protein
MIKKVKKWTQSVFKAGAAAESVGSSSQKNQKGETAKKHKNLDATATEHGCCGIHGCSSEKSDKKGER